MHQETIVLSNGKSFNVIYPNSEDEAKINDLLIMCQKNSRFVALLEKLASDYPDLTIELTNAPLFSLGYWELDTHKIMIKNKLSIDKMLQTLTFECCNATNLKFKNLNEKKFENSDDYAQFMEESEHLSYQLAYQIYLHGIETANWPKPNNLSQLAESLSIDVWMEKAKKNTNPYRNGQSHYGFYKNYFDKEKSAMKSETKEALPDLAKDNINQLKI